MAAVISPEGGAGGLVHDLGSAAVTAGVALALLRSFEELARRRVCEQVSGLEIGMPVGGRVSSPI
jgi:farnesol kinase